MTMIRDNPYELLDLDSADELPSDADVTWAQALSHDPVRRASTAIITNM